jgi:preprotein translocase subunit Sec61beta
MAQNKVSMPSSGGGLIRYFDEYKSKIQISPIAVIVIIVAVIVIELVIQKGF